MTEISQIEKYFDEVTSILRKVVREERESLDRAADWIAESLAAGGVLHVFGAGHGHLFAEELAFRAGGLVPVNPILDYGYTLMGGRATRSSRLERLEGYATTIVENYELRAGEAMIIVSQSGINPGPVEAAIAAKEIGLRVLAITSLGQSSSLPSRHSSGKRLFELADVVIDSHVPTGDAVVELRHDLPKVAAASTVVAAAILQALVGEVAHRLLGRGIEPPVWISANVPGGDEHNRKLAKDYPARMRPF